MFAVLLPLVLGIAAACPPPGSFAVLPDGRVHGDAPPQLLELRGRLANSSHPLTARELHRRYMAIIPGSGVAEAFAGLWPDGRIPFCIDASVAQADKELIIPDLIAAWDLWVMAGADVDAVSFLPGSNADCSPGNRANYLNVVTTQGALQTTLGKPSEPLMELNMNPDVAFGDRVANFAHEIGHAFGLLHEHQRPDLWSSTFGGTAPRDTFRFACEHLADYQTVAQAEGPQAIGLLCTSRNAARVTDPPFSASQILPFEAGGPRPQASAQFDRQSIMLYSSKQGGAGQGDDRLTVLTYADGSLISPNTQPSAGDVAGLSVLYPAPHPQDQPCLAFESCNPLQSIFRMIQGCFSSNPTNNHF